MSRKKNMGDLYTADAVVHDRSLEALHERDYKLARSYIDVLEDLERAIIEADKGGDGPRRPPEEDVDEEGDGADAPSPPAPEDEPAVDAPPEMTPEAFLQAQAAAAAAGEPPAEPPEPMPLSEKQRRAPPPPAPRR